MGNMHTGSTQNVGGVLQILPCGLQSFQSVFITSGAGFLTDNTSGLCSAGSTYFHGYASGDSQWITRCLMETWNTLPSFPCASRCNQQAPSLSLRWQQANSVSTCTDTQPCSHAAPSLLTRNFVTHSLRWQFHTQTKRPSWERPFLVCVKRWRGDRARERLEREKYLVLLWSFKCLLPWRKGPPFLAWLHHVKERRRLWPELEAQVRFFFSFLGSIISLEASCRGLPFPSGLKVRDTIRNIAVDVPSSTHFTTLKLLHIHP